METLIIGFLIGCAFGAILFLGGATTAASWALCC